ncbi:DUF6551 family protein, partial [Nocardia gamkensis]|uniref:DUF6551 family protein n=2 Tax=Nocardia TaxID=1817 RepID=UPI0035A16418
MTAILERPHTETPDPGESEPDTYIAAISVREIFADHTYQRELDERRAQGMAAAWDVRKVGVIDVSDRGPDEAPRYAVINGQHRWWAAALADPAHHLVAVVHTGLTVADEARLFYEIDAGTRRLTTWDRWHSRRAAGDPVVAEIEAIARKVGLVVDQSGAD